MRKYKLFIILVFVLAVTLAAMAYYRQNRNNQYPKDYPYTCHSGPLGPCDRTEDKGKVQVAQRSEVKQLVQTYGRKGVIIRALEYQDIKDKEYVKRLLGSNYMDLGCIILVDYPGGRKVYLEDDKLHVIRQLDGSSFNEMLRTATEADVQKFYNSLN